MLFRSLPLAPSCPRGRRLLSCSTHPDPSLLVLHSCCRAPRARHRGPLLLRRLLLARHRATRAGYQPLFQNSALDSDLPVLTNAITDFTDQIAKAGQTCIAREGKIFCLNLFAELFAGEALSPEEIEAFITYNAALLSLSQWLPSFQRGMAALAFLQERMQQRLERFRAWLETFADALERASQATFGNSWNSFGEGGTIPFMGMLGDKFPDAQFVITGVLGPGSNAHGPNEFLHIPTGKKVTASIAHILDAHSRRP